MKSRPERFSAGVSHCTQNPHFGYEGVDQKSEMEIGVLGGSLLRHLPAHFLSPRAFRISPVSIRFAADGA
jgi:hypothetical protein